MIKPGTLCIIVRTFMRPHLLGHICTVTGPEPDTRDGYRTDLFDPEWGCFLWGPREYFKVIDDPDAFASDPAAHTRKTKEYA